MTPDQRRLLDSLSDQAALAIERINLAEDIDRARLAAETERLRSALADLDQPRSAHAAGLDPGLGDQPRSLSRNA